MCWTIVFTGVALAATPFALATDHAGGAALVAIVFAALAVGALAVETLPRLRRAAGDGTAGAARRRPPPARGPGPRRLRRA